MNGRVDGRVKDECTVGWASDMWVGRWVGAACVGRWLGGWMGGGGWMKHGWRAHEKPGEGESVGRPSGWMKCSGRTVGAGGTDGFQNSRAGWTGDGHAFTEIPLGAAGRFS